MFYLLLAFLTLSTQISAHVYNEKSFLETKVRQFMREHEIPGMAIAVFYKGQGSLYEFGFADIELKKKVTSSTIFEIASITKVFTSTAIAVEVLRKKMNLNSPVINYLPKMRFPRGISHITLAELATHTSSLPRVPPKINGNYSAATLMQFLEQWKAPYPIGTKYVYSNLGFGVLGYALEKVEGKPYEAVIQQLITAPLLMNDTTVFVDKALMPNYAQGYHKNGRPAEHYPPNAWPGGGSLRSSSSDMLKFLRANLGTKGPKELLQAMQLAQKGIFSVNNQLIMGLGWQRFKKNGLLIVDKNGGVAGFSSYIGMLPEKKIGIVILANKGKAEATKLGRSLLVELNRLQK